MACAFLPFSFPGTVSSKTFHTLFLYCYKEPMKWNLTSSNLLQCFLNKLQNDPRMYVYYTHIMTFTKLISPKCSNQYNVL